MSFAITVVESSNDSVVINVAGEVDASNATEIVRAVLSAATPGMRSCIIDLTAVEFIDSSGIAALIEARRHLETHSIALRTRTSVPAHRILAITGVVEHLAAELPDALDPTADSQLAGTTSPQT